MRHADQFNWNDVAVVRLKKRRADGLTYGQIAHEMGLTRNAVVGKAMREGMRATEQPRGVAGGEAVKRVKAERRMAKTIPGPIPTEPTQAVELPPEDPLGHACGFFELEVASCRWPIADSPFVFCGAAQLDGYSYCSRHHTLAHRPAPRSSVPLAWRGSA